MKLAVDIQRIEKYFPLKHNVEGGFDYELAIDRQRYDEVESLLGNNGITDPTIIQELCFVILWIEDYIGVFDGADNYSEEFHQMWQEVDKLKEYLIHHRITSITLKGEYARQKPGKPFTLREEINIDRICDGIRSKFREEFQQDASKRKYQGKKKWVRRKMVKVRNYILNYMASVPGANSLSLEEQTAFIDKLSALAGMI